MRNRSSIYRRLERKIHVGYNAFVVPSTYGHKNCCSVGLSVSFQMKDNNGNDDKDDSGNIIIIIIVIIIVIIIIIIIIISDCQKIIPF